jgi:hypothetical protein
MNYTKINKLEKTNQGYRQKLAKEKDSKKREELQLKIGINEYRVRIEKLK